MRRSKGHTEAYREAAEAKLRRGEAHPTLGGTLKTGLFGESGEDFFVFLLDDCGLKETDVCVDYGCGTLRIGVHLLRYLIPGNYWGLDISQLFLDEGCRLMGVELTEKARPNLRIISPGTVAEAGRAKPRIVFSIMVAQHIHLDGLNEYIGNMLSMIGPGGQVIIRSFVSAAAFFTRGSKSYHDLAAIEATTVSLGGTFMVLRRGETRSMGDVKVTLRIMR